MCLILAATILKVNNKEKGLCVNKTKLGPCVFKLLVNPVIEFILFQKWLC